MKPPWERNRPKGCPEVISCDACPYCIDCPYRDACPHCDNAMIDPKGYKGVKPGGKIAAQAILRGPRGQNKGRYTDERSPFA